MADSEKEELLEIIWPGTGLHITTSVDRQPSDKLGDEDQVDLGIDFVSISLSPTEFIQLAASMRLSVDALLDRHPSYRRAVVEAFDIRD